MKQLTGPCLGTLCVVVVLAVESLRCRIFPEEVEKVRRVVSRRTYMMLMVGQLILFDFCCLGRSVRVAR